MRLLTAVESVLQLARDARALPARARGSLLVLGASCLPVTRACGLTRERKVECLTGAHFTRPSGKGPVEMVPRESP